MTKIVETTEVTKQADALWQEIGPFGAVGRWHPMLRRVDTDGDTMRRVQGRDGSRQNERMIEHSPEEHFYRYRMEETAMPVRNYIAEFRVDDHGDGTSAVVWSAEFEPTADEQKTVKAIKRFLKAGLKNIAAVHGVPS